jgi:hypothetical protein
MHSFQTLVCFGTILANTVLAKPTPNLEKKSFTVPVRRDTGNYTIEQAINELYKTYNKYGFPLPPGAASKRKVKRGVFTATESATQQTDNEYISPITIGGTQNFNLQFDTGSSDLWVFSTNQPAAQLGTHNVYTPDATFNQIPGETWSITYGGGDFASGNVVGTESVTIGGLTVVGQAIELASDVSTEFQDDPFADGILGLAFTKLNHVTPTQQMPWFLNIIYYLLLPVFSVNFKVGSGTIAFGIIDPTQYIAPLTTVAIDNSDGQWKFDSLTSQINGVTVNNPTTVAIAGMYTPMSVLAKH